VLKREKVPLICKTLRNNTKQEKTSKRLLEPLLSNISRPFFHADSSKGDCTNDFEKCIFLPIVSTFKVSYITQS
jgi:hypothetical protein